jgi:hypothetical protein
MAQFYQVEEFNERMQRDSADAEKSSIRIYCDSISVLGAQFGKCFPFIADWQMSDKKEEIEPRYLAPIHFSF